MFSQPRLRSGDDDPSSDLPARQLPTGPDGLDPFDCIVLGDVTPEQLSLAERERLERWVSDRGGTLIIVAGKRAMPAAYLRSESDPIRKLLPIVSSQVLSTMQGFSLTPTPEGRQMNFLQMEVIPEENDRRWKELPKHFWGAEGRVKPGARSLPAIGTPRSRCRPTPPPGRKSTP